MSIESGRVLDLGVGRGGPYIRQDGPDVLRIGMDMYSNRLERLIERYGVSGIVADADVDSGQGLPFAPASFDAIEIKFPHNELLIGLVTPETPLWSEFHRIIKPDGFVEVMFDVPKEGNREIVLKNGETITLETPEDTMWRVALDAGFSVNVHPMTIPELKQVGTDFANRTVKYMRVNPKHKAYLLVAKPLLAR